MMMNRWHVAMFPIVFFSFPMHPRWGHFRVAVYRDEKLRTEALDEIKYGSAEILLCGHSLFGNASHMKAFETINWKLIVVDEFHGTWTVLFHETETGVLYPD